KAALTPGGAARLNLVKSDRSAGGKPSEDDGTLAVLAASGRKSQQVRSYTRRSVEATGLAKTPLDVGSWSIKRGKAGWRIGRSDGAWQGKGVSRKGAKTQRQGNSTARLSCPQ